MGYAPAQAFEHQLNPRKGWFHPHSLDHQAKLSANVTFDVPAGRVAHLNSVGEYEMGVAGTQMGIYLFSGASDFDVSNPGTSEGGYQAHVPIVPTGEMLGLVATGGFEVETTEFAAEPTAAGNYAINQLLTAGTSNTVASTGGKLTNVGTGAGSLVEQYADPVCGVVSKRPYQSLHKVRMLSLWTVWLPGEFA